MRTGRQWTCGEVIIARVLAEDLVVNTANMGHAFARSRMEAARSGIVSEYTDGSDGSVNVNWWSGWRSLLEAREWGDS